MSKYSTNTLDKKGDSWSNSSKRSKTKNQRLNLKDRIGKGYEGLMIQTIFAKKRKKHKKESFIHPVKVESNKPPSKKYGNEDSENDKMSVFSRKSIIEKHIEEFLNNMYLKELNSKNGLHDVLKEVENLDINLGNQLTKE